MPTIKPINLDLDKNLQNRRFRERFITAAARDQIASQIRQLRLKRGFKNQTDFAKAARMQQSAVSRIEQSDYNGWTFRTLLKVAFALKARLRVTFEPLEESVALVKKSQAAAELDEQTISESTDQLSSISEFQGEVGHISIQDDWGNTQSIRVSQ